MKNLDKNFAYYVYGVESVEVYTDGYTKKTIPSLLCLKYGNGKLPYVFHKDKAYELLAAICGDIGPREKFEKFIEAHPVDKVLSSTLKGRGFVLVTEFKNECEYTNAGQNRIVGITALNLDGEFIAKNTNELFTDQASYEEMHVDIEDETNK